MISRAHQRRSIRYTQSGGPIRQRRLWSSSRSEETHGRLSNDWPGRVDDVFLEIYLAAHRSGRVTVVDYALALENEYLRGVLIEFPLLVGYGLQARELPGQIATLSPAKPRADPSRNTGRL